MSSYPIASEKSYEVLQERRRLGEIALPPRHEPVQVEETFYIRISGLKELDRAYPLTGIEHWTPGRYWKHGKR